MAVDSFKFLPRSFRAEYEVVTDPPGNDVWTSPSKPASASTFALLTSAGLHLKDGHEPFDLDGERENPMWGDPSYRVIPRRVTQDDLTASHLHINTRDLELDFNVSLPIEPFRRLESEGAIGRLADEHYSFMGYQHRDLVDWREFHGPQLAAHLEESGVDVLLLAPA